MAAQTQLDTDDFDLELAVLRESVAAIDIGRQRCSCCGRTPLVGEYVFRYRSGEAECEICRSLRRDSPPAAVEQVRHAGGHLTVQAATPVVRPWLGGADVAHG